ncbi:hypothetical protein BCF11_5008 [Collimonas sp. PA-H2]|uniref:hypothetical protein n=1 Tax=Collimonas sp. PA-H2 TaxID=1881062 RepID=UPI000BF59FDB|nr:hypothetical protein [Collimonas sp. PA-H2]PFH12523.1 hypothetical protein BCF11_5008 [Collimonas sp. PA-H2]
MIRKFSVALIAASSLALTACAPMVATAPAKIALTAQTQPARQIRILKMAHVTLDTGYQRDIPLDSIWRYAGDVPQGQVFRPVKSVFTIEGRQVHEAYLVISDAALVGFYLPGESNYSALSNRVLLTIGNVSND